MTTDEVLDEFRAAGALLEGHFVLSSGRRSPMFLQKVFVFMDPARTERLCRALADKARASFGEIDVVVAPALGAIVPGYETARALGAKSMFVERVEGGLFALRRGYAVPSGARVLVVEDVVTTGLSIRECLAALDGAGGEVVGAACLVDRSGGEARVGVPLIALASLRVPDYDPADLPPELAAIPPVKPGSRGLVA